MENIQSVTPPRQRSLSYDQANIINEYRAVLSRLTYLTRFYIIAKLTDVGDAESIRNRILEIPIEINQLVQRLTGITENPAPISISYITDTLSLIDRMVSGEQPLGDEGLRELNLLSDEYSAYLASLSPYWDENTWRSLFSTYNQALIEEVIALQAGDYNTALDIFEVLMDMALKRGDYYAEAVIPLFPEGQPQIPTVYYNMIRDFRKLQTEWAYLTRFYIVASITGIDESDYLTQKLSELVSRSRERYELILGYEAAEEMANILLIYGIRLQGLVQAILSGDEANIQAAMASFDELNNRLVASLRSINPYWDEIRGSQLFDTSSDLVVQLAQDFQRKDYAASLETFDDYLYNALAIGDFLAMGLYQFTTMNEETSAQ